MQIQGILNVLADIIFYSPRTGKLVKISDQF